MSPIVTLFPELPTKPPTLVPKIDRLTRILVRAFRFREPNHFRQRQGVAICNCGADPMDGTLYRLGPPGAELLVDGFCIHRLAFHRPDMSLAQMDLIRRLGLDEEEPLTSQLRPPNLTRTVKPVLEIIVDPVG